MVQLLRTIVLIVPFLGCQTSFDPDLVDEGMTTRQLIQAVGKPDEKLPLTGDVMLWRYEGDHTVIVSESRVLNVGIMTKADYEQTLKDIQFAMDSLEEAQEGRARESQ